MDHCLVFGARGHLAKTRIIPALKRMNCPYTPIVRHQVPDLHHLRDTKDLVAYMSIPTHNFCEAVEPYLEMVDPIYVLEKPHGHSKFDFERIKDKSVKAFTKFKSEIDTRVYPGTKHDIQIIDVEFKKFMNGKIN